MQFLSRSKNQATDSIEPANMSHQAVDPEKGVHTDASHDKATDQESLSSNAQAGVKAVEAAATVWTKYHLIGAYIMSVSLFYLIPLLTSAQHLVDLLRHRPSRGRHSRHEPIRDQRLPSPLPYSRYRNHVLHHRRVV